MILSFDNKILLDKVIEVARLKNSPSAGSDVALTVDDNNGIAQNDFLVIGSPLTPKTEIAKVNAAVTLGTALQVDSLTFPHASNDPIYRIQYDQIRLFHADTLTGTKSQVGSEKDIDIDQKFTQFEISDGATGYYFLALYNSQTTTQGQYSDGLLVTEHTIRTRSKIKQIISELYSDPIADDSLQLFIDMTIEEIYAHYDFNFRKASVSFSVTSDTTEYDIEDDAGISDFGKLISAKTSTRMLEEIESNEDDLLSLNPVVLMPNTISVWNDKFIIRSSEDTTVTVKYYKNMESLTSSQTKTGVRLVSAIVFGVLALLNEGRDERQSDRFSLRQARAIKLLKKADEDTLGISSLPSATSRRYGIDTTPNIT